MKILQINKFHYLKGGSEKVYFDTCEFLAQAGNHVINFSMKNEKNKPSQYEKYFVDYVDFQAKGFFQKLKQAPRVIYNFQAKKKLQKLIDNEQPQVAHIHNFMHQLTPSILTVLKKNKIPVVQTLHDFQLICPNWSLFTHGKVCERCKPRKFYNSALHKCVHNSFFASFLAMKEMYWQRIFKYYKEKVDFFIAPSEFLKNKLQEWGIEENIEVIHNAVDLQELKPQCAAGDYLVCVSRLQSGKGVFDLIKAMENLPEIGLKIIGDGPLKQKMADYIKKNHLTHIDILGQKKLFEVYEIIKDSSFVVVPSKMYDVYPTVILEANALGKPVLGAKIGGILEMIDDDKTGWFFEPGDVEDLHNKIRAFFTQKELVENLGAQARQKVEKENSQPEYVEKLLRVYSGLKKEDSELG